MIYLRIFSASLEALKDTILINVSVAPSTSFDNSDIINISPKCPLALTFEGTTLYESKYSFG